MCLFFMLFLATYQTLHNAHGMQCAMAHLSKLFLSMCVCVFHTLSVALCSERVCVCFTHSESRRVAELLSQLPEEANVEAMMEVSWQAVKHDMEIRGVWSVDEMRSTKVMKMWWL